MDRKDGHNQQPKQAYYRLAAIKIKNKKIIIESRSGRSKWTLTDQPFWHLERGDKKKLEIDKNKRKINLTKL